jgi:serine/threonine-protein kinase
MDQRHLNVRVLALLLLFPATLSARPRGVRVDDASTATPVAGVLLTIDPATGKETELLKVNAQSLGPPVVVGTTVYVASSGKVLYALDARTGQKKWEHKSEQLLFGLAATAQTVFVGAGGALDALDARSGNVLWSYEGDIPVADPVLADDLIVFNAFDGPVAIEQSTGQLRWRLKVQWGYFVFSALPDGKLCVWKPDETWVVDTRSGKTLWQSPAEAGMAAPGTLPTPAVGMGNMICQMRGSQRDARDRTLHVFDAGSGHLFWKAALGEHEEAGNRILIDAGGVFCVLDDNLVCLDFANGQVKWSVKIEPLEAGGPGVLADKRSVYIPELSGDVVALDIKTGQPGWRNAAPHASPHGNIRIGGIGATGSAIYVTRIDQVRR